MISHVSSTTRARLLRYCEFLDIQHLTQICRRYRLVPPSLQAVYPYPIVLSFRRRTAEESSSPHIPAPKVAAQPQRPDSWRIVSRPGSVVAFPSRPICPLCFNFPGNRFPPRPIVFLLRSCKTPTPCMQLFTFLALAIHLETATLRLDARSPPRSGLHTQRLPPLRNRQGKPRQARAPWPVPLAGSGRRCRRPTSPPVHRRGPRRLHRRPQSLQVPHGRT